MVYPVLLLLGCGRAVEQTCHYIQGISHKETPYEDLAECEHAIYPDIFDLKEETYGVLQLHLKKGYSDIIHNWQFSRVNNWQGAVTCNIDLITMHPRLESKSLASVTFDRLVETPLTLEKSQLATTFRDVASQLQIVCRHKDITTKDPHKLSIQMHLLSENLLYQGPDQFWTRVNKYFEGNFTTFGPEDIARTEAANIVYANIHVHVWKTKRERKRKPDIVFIHAESSTYHDLKYRMPRLLKLLEHDDFTIFHHVNILGYNTYFHMEGINRGSRDVWYVSGPYPHSTIDKDIDWQLENSIWRDVEAEGYTTMHLSDIDDSPDTTESDLGDTRPVKDIDHVTINASLYRLYDSVLGRWDNTCSPVFPGVGSHNGKIVEQALLNLEEPTFAYVDVDALGISHDHYNTSHVQEYTIAMLSGKARNAILENAFTIIMGDHGHRRNQNITQEYTDYHKLNSEAHTIERVSPLLAIRLPNRLRRKHPYLQEKLLFNQRGLVTVLDVRETILDIIWSRFDDDPAEYRINTMKGFPGFDLTNKKFQGDLHRYWTNINRKGGLNIDTKRYSDCRRESTCSNKITGGVPNKWGLTASPFSVNLYTLANNDTSYNIGNACEEGFHEDGVGAPDIDVYVNMEVEGPIYHSQAEAGISLFKKISTKRDCKDAASPSNYCSCYKEGARILLGIDNVDEIGQLLDLGRKELIGRSLLYDKAREESTKYLVEKKNMSKRCVDEVYKSMWSVVLHAKNLGNLGEGVAEDCYSDFHHDAQALVTMMYNGRTPAKGHRFYVHMLTEMGIEWGYSMHLGPIDLDCFGKDAEVQEGPVYHELDGFPQRLEVSYGGTLWCTDETYLDQICVCKDRPSL